MFPLGLTGIRHQAHTSALPCPLAPGSHRTVVFFPIATRFSCYKGFFLPQNITNEVRRIEPEKVRKIQDCEAFIESVPNTGSATLVKNKVENTNKKYDRVVQLLSAAQEK